MVRAVLCFPVESRHVRQIEAVDSDVEVVDAGQKHVAEALLQADIFCGHAKVPVPWDEITRLGRLRWIQSSAAGLDHCLKPPVIESEIAVTSASGLFADQVAEQALVLLLALLRDLPKSLDQQRGRIFTRHATSDLHGSTIGIIGLGGNGRRLVEVLSVFNTRILASDVFHEDWPSGVERVWPADLFHEMLPLVDTLVLCVPLTASTRRMIDAGALHRMKPGARLINVARGQVVVESDLVRALRSGHLSGAGLDVTEMEPLPPDSPLWTLPNVVITPHMGAQSPRRIDDTVDFFCENLRRFRDGRPLLNLVDKQLGFPRDKIIWTRPSRLD